ncbi:MAG: hypothetical protein GX945_00205 [Lentisphaerae bacterium]|nr:hypothetical protein [Lentisphaerota bacterium]
MTQTPPLNADNRRDMTSRFINDYIFHRHLTQAGAADHDDGADKYDAAYAQVRSTQRPADFDWRQLQAGEIRLLSQPDTLCYVLIVQRWDTAHYLVLPFSRFPLPATDEEILLSHTRTEYLSVLQLWNARTLHPLFLRRSWLVDTLTDDELALAQDALAYVLTGEGDCEHFINRMALPIRRPFDPRLDYKNTALEHYAALDATDFDWAQQCELYSETAVWSESTAPAENTVAEKSTPVETDLIIPPRPPIPWPPIPRRPPRPFPFPKTFLKPVAYAAAGDEELSPCWFFDAPSNRLLPRLHAQELQPEHLDDESRARARYCYPDFSPAPLDPEANLLWDIGKLNLPADSYDALFIHTSKRILLGSGFAQVNEYGANVVFSDWLSEDAADVRTPSDVSIFLCKEAQL